MKWARWDTARHSLTIVADGATTRVRADLSPSFSVQFTPPVDNTPLVATPRLWASGNDRQWASGNDREWI